MIIYMKIKLHYMNKRARMWTNNPGMDFCHDILCQLGLKTSRRYTLYVSRVAKKGFQKIELFKGSVGTWRWEIEGITSDSIMRWFATDEINHTLNKMFPGKVRVGARERCIFDLC